MLEVALWLLLTPTCVRVCREEPLAAIRLLRAFAGVRGFRMASRMLAKNERAALGEAVKSLATADDVKSSRDATAALESLKKPFGL